MFARTFLCVRSYIYVDVDCACMCLHQGRLVCQCILFKCVLGVCLFLHLKA